MEERYGTLTTDEGTYVFDRLDERPIGEPLPPMTASLRAARLNSQDRIQTGVISRIQKRRNESITRMMTHTPERWFVTLSEEFGKLAVAAGSGEGVEEALERLAATALAWMEDLDRSR